jgi:hypothetical protein
VGLGYFGVMPLLIVGWVVPVMHDLVWLYLPAILGFMGGKSPNSGVVAFLADGNEAAFFLRIWALLSDMGFGPFGPNSLTVTPHFPSPRPSSGYGKLFHSRTGY